VPYTKQNIPEAAKGLPSLAQDVFIGAFNAAWKEYDGDESRSMATAWSAVKKKYKKEGDSWIPINSNHLEDDSKLVSIEMEIFKGGKQTDSSGVDHDGDDLIEKAIKSFDPEKFRPPLQLDHSDGPSYGWTKDLFTIMKNGVKHLVAKLSVIPEVVDLIKRQLYKTRSAGFYSDGTLNHVALLGAAVPAVKGLGPIKLPAFNETLKILLFEEDNMSTKEKEEVVNPMQTITITTEKYNEELQKQKDQLMKEFQAQTQTSGKKHEQEVKELIAKFEKEISDIKFNQAKKEIDVFIDDFLKEGKIVQKTVESGLKEFMVSLLSKGNTFNFNEKETSELTWFKNFLSGNKAEVPFGEFDKPAEKVPDNKDSAIEMLVSEYQTKNPTMNYRHALDQIQIDHKELFS